MKRETHFILLGIGIVAIVFIIYLVLPQYDTIEIFGCKQQYQTQFSILQTICNFRTGGHCTGTLSQIKNADMSAVGVCLCHKYSEDNDKTIADAILNLCNSTWPCYSHINKSLSADVICGDNIRMFFQTGIVIE